MKRAFVSYPSKQDDGTEKVKRKGGKKIIVEVTSLSPSLSPPPSACAMCQIIISQKKYSEDRKKYDVFWQKCTLLM